MLKKIYLLSALIASGFSVSHAAQRPDPFKKNDAEEPRRRIGGFEEFDNVGSGFCSLYALGFSSPDEALAKLNQYADTHIGTLSEPLLARLLNLIEPLRALKETPSHMPYWLTPSQIRDLGYFTLGLKINFLDARFHSEGLGSPVPDIEHELGETAVDGNKESALHTLVPSFSELPPLFLGYRVNHYTTLVKPNDHERRRIAGRIEQMKKDQLEKDRQLAEELSRAPLPAASGAAAASSPPPAPPPQKNPKSAQEEDQRLKEKIDALCQRFEIELKTNPKNEEAQNSLKEALSLRSELQKLLSRKI